MTHCKLEFEHCAAAYVDEGALAELSMRNLGDRLGAGAMSLYNHLAGKEEILDGIIAIERHFNACSPCEGLRIPS